MSRAVLDRLIFLVGSFRLKELVYESGDVRIRLAKGSVTPGPATAAAAADLPLSQPSPPASERPIVNHSIRAGLTGTFFRSPSPDAAPYARIGDHVKVGQPVGLIEAMKMLNEIEADCAGRIIDILVEDGSSLTAGTPLLIIEPDDTSHV